MCDKINHPLVEIYRSSYLDIEEVVRWCPDCGAIVIDGEVDGKIQPGNFMKMRLTKEINKEKT